MFLRSFTLSVTIVALSACNNNQKSSESVATSIPADIIVRATSELNAPSPIMGATFVPNSVASWLGHIIMIDKSGNLHRSTSDSKVRLIDEGNYKSVIGLARIKQPGVFLAITQNGTLKAFIEADDEGNFKALPISIDDSLRLSEFCANVMPLTDTIMAVDKDNKVYALPVDIADNASVTLGDVTPTANTSCAALTYDTDKSLELKEGSSYLSVNVSNQMKTMSISHGLSIAGIDTPAFATATSANMGSVFRNGVVLVSEKDSGRIVLIARDYFIDSLESR